ncbi:MAG: preprotein translocase subunit YajC [Eubacteriaceae bacterium]|nr:preprotein translocase subunit YajC [Eubacteriaceae bacterium]
MENPTVFILIAMAVMLIPSLFMGRSQKKQQQQRQYMLDNLEAGDKVITSGGFTGVIDRVSDASFIIRFSPDSLRLEVAKEAVIRKVEDEDEIPELETEYDYIIDDDDDDDAEGEQEEQ